MEKHLHNPFEKNDYMCTKFFAGLIQLNRKIFTLSSKILLLVLSILFLFTFSFEKFELLLFTIKLNNFNDNHIDILKYIYL